MYACPSLGRAGQCGFGGRGVTVAPEVPTAAHEEPEQPPEVESSASEPAQEPLRRSQSNRKSAIPANYEVYISEDADTEGDPTSFEEAMRSRYSSKWQAAMEDEMRSMNSNKVWDLEEISKGAKTVGCK